jgi:peptide methionine sulfoxide reductase MsrB
MTFPIQKTDEEWRIQLSPEQYRILRNKGTEMAGMSIPVTPTRFALKSTPPDRND